MNEQDHEVFEAELRRLTPARLPDEFEARLNAPPPTPSRTLATRQRSQVWRPDWSFALRWLTPVTAVAAAFLAVVVQLNRGRNSAPPTTTASAPTLNADQVEIDRQLLGSFDAVANMPEGEPVRFRFQQWMDAVTLRDSIRGIEVVQRTPRIEVVPVSFATY
jgi:hypothetical protein